MYVPPLLVPPPPPPPPLQYLSELTLLDADPYLKYCPSVIAASAVCLARHTLGLAAWVGASREGGGGAG